MGKLEALRPMGRPSLRWVDNISTGLWAEGLYRVLVAKPEGKRPLGRPRLKCLDNIRMDLWQEGVYSVLLVKLE